MTIEMGRCIFFSTALNVVRRNCLLTIMLLSKTYQHCKLTYNIYKQVIIIFLEFF